MQTSAETNQGSQQEVYKEVNIDVIFVKMLTKHDHRTLCRSNIKGKIIVYGQMYKQVGIPITT